MRFVISIITCLSLTTVLVFSLDDQKRGTSSVDDGIIDLIKEDNKYYKLSEERLQSTRGEVRQSPRQTPLKLKDIKGLSEEISSEEIKGSIKIGAEEKPSSSLNLKKSLDGLHPDHDFDTRCQKDGLFQGKDSRLRSTGFPSDGVLEAVELGLKWFQSEQKSDGSWGRGLNDTCLALLPFLAQCELSSSAKFGDTFKRGIDFVRNRRTEKKFEYYTTGEFYKHDGDLSDLVTHALRTTVLAEYYVMTKKPTLVEGLEQSADGIINTRGFDRQWGSSYLAHLNIQALHALTFTQIRKKEVVDCMLDYSKVLKKNLSSNRYSSKLAGDILSLQLCQRGDSSDVNKGLELLRQRNQFDKAPPAVRYFEASAFYQSTIMTSIYWREWNRLRFVRDIIDSQLLDGCWTEKSPENSKYSDLETTVFTLLILQNPYRYRPTKPLPDDQKGFWEKIFD
jgi:hypothetical protein